MTRNTAKILILVGALIALAVAVYTLPIAAWLQSLIQWIDANKQIAWIVYIGCYILATVFMVPGTILTVAAGFVFGVPIGTALVSVSSIAGATAAFLVGRWLGRDWVRSKMGSDARLAAIDRATDEKGFLIVLLLRLSPLFPFNATNYFLSLTGTRLRHYFFASWIGMFPGTVLYVYIGSIAQELTDLLSGNFEAGIAGRIFFVGGLIATAVVTIIVARFAARTLQRELAASGDTSTTPES